MVAGNCLPLAPGGPASTRVQFRVSRCAGPPARTCEKGQSPVGIDRDSLHPYSEMAGNLPGCALRGIGDTGVKGI